MKKKSILFLLGTMLFTACSQTQEEGGMPFQKYD